MKYIFSLFRVGLVLVFSHFLQAQTAVPVYLDGGLKTHQIDKHIYGHFSEHLGRCIYDGFWVSDTLKVAKKDRIRLDIVDALKKIKVPNLKKEKQETLLLRRIYENNIYMAGINLF